MLKEFKEFLMRGNIVELAVAVIIGGAFKAIVDSLVKDIISPIIAMVANTGDIAAVSFKLGSAQIGIGAFIAAIINFVIVGAVLFLIIKGMNKASEIKYFFYSTDKKKYSFCDGTLFNGDKFHLEVIKDTKKDVELKFILEDYLKEIRDLLANK